DLRDKINFSPSQGRYKVYIIDEVHMLSTSAFNALLKTLEEPPPHAIFILATTEIHKIPATVLSRCQRHEFRRIPVNDIVTSLQNIANKEGFQADEDALLAIARQATGAMRDAISLLDQLASTGEKITLETAQNVLGTATDQSILELVDAILQQNPRTGLDCLHRALDRGSDARQFARQAVDYLRDLLLIKLNNHDQIDATADMLTRMKQHASAFSHTALIETINAFNKAASDLRSAWQPSLPLELALASVINLSDTAPTPAVVETPETASTPAKKVQPEKISQPQKPAETPPAPTNKPRQTAPAKKSPPTDVPPEPSKSQDEPQTETAAAPPTQEAANVSPADIDLNTIKKNWKNIRSVVKKHSKPTEALLNSCKLLTVKKGVLILGFSTSVLQSKMNTPENLELTRNAITHLLGVEVPITTVITRGNSGELPPNLDIDADGMVNTALNLGGKIVKQD
ncbi:MAG: DNA polymerase III subunit gamma/tau, partial [Anaerolineaceae bacterium]|nr:DNA polymerase III subunit gamma/tau [Anaerolineaceae bacterium]